MLEEVTVTGRRRLIEPSAGGVKANVAGTSLAHLPFVTSRNGSLSVLGSGTPEIYINSRKVRDLGELDRLRASEILSAEVITAPGPEYAADVPAVIRIRTLRQRGEGWSGSVNLGYNQGRWANGDQQVALNFRTGGLDFFVKGYVSEKNSYGETEAVIRTEGKDVWETVAGDVQTSRSQRFSAEADNFIRQRAFAVFAGYSASWGKWRANAGLRYEHRATDYWDLSLALAWKTMRTNPSYALLTNAVSYRTQYSYTTGNPGLEPSQASILSLNLAYKWLFAYVQYSYSRNSLSNITMPYNEETHPGVLLFTSANLAPGSGCIINLSAAPRIGVWQPQFSITGVYAAPDGRNLGIEVWHRQPLFNFGWDNSFTLPQGWFLNVQGSLQTAARMGFMVNRLEGRLNARVSKSFLKDDALTLSLTADDILRTGYYHFNVYGIDSYNGNRIYRDWQRVGIQLSYKFNATKSKYKGTGAGQSEKARL